MAITWGAWKDDGSYGMRVGMDVSASAVGASSPSITYTIRVYTQNRKAFGSGDWQSLEWRGSFPVQNATNFENTQGTSSVLRATKTYVHTYDNYGVSPGQRTFRVDLFNVFGESTLTPINGATVSATVTIPARPILAPLTPEVTAEAVTTTSVKVSWLSAPDPSGAMGARPINIGGTRASRWDNVSNAWGAEFVPTGLYEFSQSGLSANRSYRWRVRQTNDAGSSANGYSAYIQTPPAAPSGLTVGTVQGTSLTLSWTNGPATNYTYTTEVEAKVGSGPWEVVQTVGKDVRSVSRTGLAPATTYQYRVRHKSTVGQTTYSAYVTSAAVTTKTLPPAPSNVAVEFYESSDEDWSGPDANASIKVSWTNNPVAAAPYTSITVQRWRSTSGNWEPTPYGGTGGTAAGEQLFWDMEHSLNEKIQYRVRANNAAGSSDWVYSTFVYTRPLEPTNIEVRYTGSSQITVTWQNRVSHSEYLTVIGWSGTPVEIPAGQSSYTFIVNPQATNSFSLSTKNTWNNKYSVTAAMSQPVPPAAPPIAPTALSMGQTQYVDFERQTILTWRHNPQADLSAQTRYEVRHRVHGSATWVESGVLESETHAAVNPWSIGIYTNADTVEVQVRTWGIHADASPWSASALFIGRTTPVLTLVDPEDGIIAASPGAITWNFFQAQGGTQSSYRMNVTNLTNMTALTSMAGETDATSITIDRPVENGDLLRVEVQVYDNFNMASDEYVWDFEVSFTPPALPQLAADADPESGVVVLTVNPTEDDGGITTYPTIAVDIERQLLDFETGEMGAWEPVAVGVAPTATIVDTTAPLGGEGIYRVTAYSATPSMAVQPIGISAVNYDDKWAYLSGGTDFRYVCRFWAEIEMGWKASRTKALHYFAGRSKPVIYSGEASERSMSVKAIITSDASKPDQWLALAQQPGPVLLRIPGQQRIYGALSELAVDRVDHNLHSVSFSIQEVYR